MGRNRQRERRMWETTLTGGRKSWESSYSISPVFYYSWGEEAVEGKQKKKLLSFFPLRVAAFYRTTCILQSFTLFIFSSLWIHTQTEKKLNQQMKWQKNAVAGHLSPHRSPNCPKYGWNMQEVNWFRAFKGGSSSSSSQASVFEETALTILLLTVRILDR